jgi:uncharacterized membrane protein YkvA (DUF1232 family)
VGWIDDGIIAALLVSELSQMLLERLNAATKTKPQPNQSPTPDATTPVDVEAVSVE